MLLILGEVGLGKEAVNAHPSAEDYRCTCTQKVRTDTAVFCSFFLRQLPQEPMLFCRKFVWKYPR